MQNDPNSASGAGNETPVTLNKQPGTAAPQAVPAYQQPAPQVRPAYQQPAPQAAPAAPAAPAVDEGPTDDLPF